jgi:hypothetical protein
MAVRKPEQIEPKPRAARRKADGEGLGSPRVVILEAEDGPRVEIVELSECIGPGDSFCHCGTRWQVTATRTGERVLIARPLRA